MDERCFSLVAPSRGRDLGKGETVATLDELYSPDAFRAVQPIARKLGAVNLELDGGVVIVKTVYGVPVEIGRGATVKQAVQNVMENAASHERKTNG